MSETFVQVAPNSSGEKVAVSQLSNGVDSVDIQHIVIADDTTYAARAKVQNAEPASADYGLSVRRVCSGASIYQAVAAASTNASNIKASAGRITGWSMYNNASYPVFVKFHNTASTPTAGSGVVYTIGIPPGKDANFDDDDGLNFATGIGISIVQGIALADTTALAASDCVVCIHFK
jgi:hypothetical protein